MAITHSPPLDNLRSFEKGLTEDEIKSPNLVKFPPSVVQEIEQTQLPYHILLRNVQAEINKCCHWNAGSGTPDKFFLAEIIDGPDTNVVIDPKGGAITTRGVRVKNSVFPDEVGTFFPVGTTVVAGFEDQPSFYLEPRTGLVVPGEDVIFRFTGAGASPPPARVVVKQIASDSNSIVVDAVRAAAFACVTAQSKENAAVDFANNAAATNDPATITAAASRLSLAVADSTTACDASTAAQLRGQDAIDEIALTIAADAGEDLFPIATELALTLEELADLVETAGGAVGGTSAADETAVQVFLLRRNSRNLKFSAAQARTKCGFFFEEDNIAKTWNSPTDGTLPCNGVRTSCPFYTAESWEFATDERMDLGQPVIAEQIQEVRFRSEDWTRFTDPAEEFSDRFTTPFIWAFKGYLGVAGEPDLEDMLLYRPKVLYSRATRFTGYETIKLEKVEVANFEDFRVSKSTGRVTPGSEVLNKEQPPPFPSLISEPTVPSAVRLSITHPRETDTPFIYRIWSPGKNKISLFGTASPDHTVYIINDTALQHRNRYHAGFGTRNFFDVPTLLNNAPGFVGFTETELLELVVPLRDEKAANTNIEAPLGFDAVISDLTGFWQSLQEVDLVHNEINKIYVFVVGSETNILVSKTTVDCRFLHSIVTQTSFDGLDFTILSLGAGGGSRTGNNAEDTAQRGVIDATVAQFIGESKEALSIDYGYFGWRFKDRGLEYGTLNADADLKGQDPIADVPTPVLAIEANPDTFITNVAYNVVQYKKENIIVENWYVINDCGFIMMVLDDLRLNRVLPLPNQAGDQKALSNILINGGGVGSEIAQWGLIGIQLTTNLGVKTLVQIYRDPDGFGLPANYVIIGPPVNDTGSNAFGRPDPTVDTLEVSYTFIQAQSTRHEPEGGAESPIDDPVIEEDVEIVTDNFFSDNLRTHKHAVSFDETSLTAGGTTLEDRISSDQQDYVFVFSDSEGRPLGKKVTRMQVMYYNLACINVDIFYRWAADCTTYALIPDRALRVGTAGGTVEFPPGATTDASDTRLQLGSRIQNLLGDRDCQQTPSCGDHEFLALGPLRREFEVIVRVEGEDDEPAAEERHPGGHLHGGLQLRRAPGTGLGRAERICRSGGQDLRGLRCGSRRPDPFCKAAVLRASLVLA